MVQQNTKARIGVEDLTMAYGDFVIQRDLNFEISRGDIFIIMGDSGCGKSTLLATSSGSRVQRRDACSSRVRASGTRTPPLSNV